MLKHHISCQPAFQHIVCHQSKTNPYQRPPPVLDWSYLVHLPLTGKRSKKSQFVAQIFHFSIEDKTCKSKHIYLCGVVCLCGHESGVPLVPRWDHWPQSHMFNLVIAPQAGASADKKTPLCFLPAHFPQREEHYLRKGKKQNKTKRNKTQGQRMTALPSRGSNAVSAASSCILTQYLDDGSFSPMLLIQHCTAVVSQAPRRIPFTNRVLCFVFVVFVALVRLEYRGNGDFDHRRYWLRARQTRDPYGPIFTPRVFLFSSIELQTIAALSSSVICLVCGHGQVV